MPANGLRVLIGWKEIAQYLGCSTSTAVRRMDDGLPVFRVGGSVRAFADDIDRWLEGERIRKLEAGPEGEAGYPGIVVGRSNIVEAVSAYARDKKDERFAIVPLGIDTSKYEKIEHRLKSAEDKYRWLLETVPVWIWETNAAGEYTYSNVAVLDILGYRPEELAGFDPVEFLVAPEDVAKYKDEMDNLRSNKKVIRDCQCRHIHRDTSVKWLETDAEPIFDRGGEFSGIRGVSRDVTKRKRAEEALRRSERQYRTLSENIPVGIFRTTADPTGRIISANTALARMFGFDRPEEITNERVADFYADPMARSEFIGAIAVKGIVTNYEGRFKRRDGKEFYGSISARAVHGADGSILYYDGVCEDITERHRAETALLKSESEKTLILENVAELVVYVSRDLRIVWANQAASRWAGVGIMEMVDRSCYAALYGKPAPCEDCHVLRAMATGQPQEAELTSADGSILRVWCNPVRDPDGKICGAVEVSLDITKPQRIEEALRKTLARNEVLLGAIPYSAYIINRNGTYRSFDRDPAGTPISLSEGAAAKNIRDVVFAAETERDILEKVEETLATGASLAVGYELLTRYGRRFLEGRLVKLNGDEVLAIVPDFRDLTTPAEADSCFTAGGGASYICREFVRARDINEAINASLAIIGSSNGPGRSYVFLLSNGGTELVNTHEWCSEGVEPRPDEFRRIGNGSYKWGLAKLQGGEILSVLDVRTLPPEARAEREALEAQGVKSLLVIPLFADGEFGGFVGFDSVAGKVDWNESRAQLLRCFANTWSRAVKGKSSVGKAPIP